MENNVQKYSLRYRKFADLQVPEGTEAGVSSRAGVSVPPASVAARPRALSRRWRGGAGSRRGLGPRPPFCTFFGTVR